MPYGGSCWLLHDLPTWPVVYQQSQRWMRADVFESPVHDLRDVLRIAEGREEKPTAVCGNGPCFPKITH
jgi:hypothetical protein